MNKETKILSKQFVIEVQKTLNIYRTDASYLADNIGYSRGYVNEIMKLRKPVTFMFLAKVQCSLRIKFSISTTD